MVRAVDGTGETGGLRMACQSAGKPVNPPVKASKPTCTLCTKFVGVPIGADKELRRYKASRQVYISELS